MAQSAASTEPSWRRPPRETHRSRGHDYAHSSIVPDTSDHASGRLDARPGLDAALDYLRPGDQLVITKLDRLGRSLPHLVSVASDLRSRQVDLAVLDQGLDTSTPGGRAVYAIMAALAEFEREMISERTRAGLAAARARGRKGGRRPVMTPEKIAIARQMYESREHTVETIATTVGVSRGTIYAYLGEDQSAKP